MLKLKKRMVWFISIFFTSILFGCTVQNYDTEKEKDVDYTIVTEDEMPEEIQKILSESQEENFRKTYSDRDYMYLIIGYGAQPTSGYSIEVQEVYESSNAVYITTMLKGPSRTEKVFETVTYPSVVVKIANTEKPVVFR